MPRVRIFEGSFLAGAVALAFLAALALPKPALAAEAQIVVDQTSFTPALAGSRLAYVQFDDGRYTLHLRDLVDGSDKVIPGSVGARWRPALDGERLVFENHTSDTGPELQMYDLATGQLETLTDNLVGHLDPSISGDTIAYERRPRLGLGEIVLLDLRTGDETPAVPGREADQHDPAISGRTLVWSEGDADGSNLYSMDLDTGRITTITAEPGYHERACIDGDTVVWAAWPKTSGGNRLAELWGCDLKTLKPVQLTDGENVAYSPTVSAGKLAWEDYYTPGFRQARIAELDLDGSLLSGEAVGLTRVAARSPSGGHAHPSARPPPADGPCRGS